MRIAFLGLGKMGLAIVPHLAQGHAVTVWNRTAKAADSLRDTGVQVAASPAEAVKDADVVFSTLLNDAAVEEVFLGSDAESGAIAAMQPGAIHVCLSTISVASSKRLTSAHEAAGKPFVGAPVFGRPHVAAQARLWSAIAGDEASLSKVRPLIERYSRGLTEVGAQPWAAHAMKIGGNFMITAMIASLTEGFIFAESEGIDPAVYLQVINQGLFQSPFYELYGKLMLEPPVKPGGTVSLGEKDARLFLEAARESRAPTPLGEMFHQHLLRATKEGMQDEDWAGGYYRLARQLAHQKR
ncbi:MAG: NAD(P)-dependent oxidoreductase [Acidobacteria bacterium]|jgi:3-hydroxyisobutyrate dehydrogenase-like beta-hydroxyacid dehydrogenase|nr:NAD(P)-dependent oxidoreductase [Acidobacteriota bacterium]